MQLTRDRLSSSSDTANSVLRARDSRIVLSSTRIWETERGQSRVEKMKRLIPTSPSLDLFVLCIASPETVQGRSNTFVRLLARDVHLMMREI